jgi:hypothetical protein
MAQVANAPVSVTDITLGQSLYKPSGVTTAPTREKPTPRLIAWMIAVAVVFLALSAAGFVVYLNGETFLGNMFFIVAILIAAVWVVAVRRGHFG